jgi:hypothetical protein
VVCSAKIPQVAHFSGCTKSLVIPNRAAATHRGRGVKSLPRPPNLPLYTSFHDGPELCAPVRIGREGRSEDHNRMSRFDSGVCSDSTDR